jgi:hypothetical protein
MVVVKMGGYKPPKVEVVGIFFKKKYDHPPTTQHDFFSKKANPIHVPTCVG